jgi:GNAT superfamily N-acetyltransferase
MPLIEYESPDTSDVFHEIAKNTAKLIEDGSTLNLGVGKIPFLLPKYLTDKQDLAIFSEFLMESVVDMIKDGIVTCKQNTFPHCMTSFIIGTKRFYDFVDNNPFIEFHPTDFITDLQNIGRNKKLCSIYSALSVDFIGQVTNDLPKRLYSGIGGEADFIRGSLLSKGGKSIIALPSTTESGKSRIVPILMYSPVALRAFEIQYVVTEYGIANLHGKTLRERVLSLIGIAHPKHRKWLLNQAKQANLIYQDQKIPMTEDGTVLNYPQVSWTYQIKNGEKVDMRPIQPIDERLIQELYYSLSPDDRVLRFFTNRKYFNHKITHYIISSIDYNKQYIIGGFVGKEEGNQRIIAITEYHCEEDSNFPELGEFAITIHEDYRGKGLGRFLMNTLIDVAKENGLKGLKGDVLAYNEGMLHLLETLPYDVTLIREQKSFAFRFRFDELKEKGDESEV